MKLPLRRAPFATRRLRWPNFVNKCVSAKATSKKKTTNAIMHRVLVYGGKGALGSTLVKALKGKGNFVAISIDLAKNDDANVSIVLSPSQSWEEQAKNVETEIEKSLNGEKLDAVLCVAGGWAGGNVKSKDLIKSTELMWKVSVQTSIHAAHLAALHLKEYVL